MAFTPGGALSYKSTGIRPYLCAVSPQTFDSSSIPAASRQMMPSPDACDESEAMRESNRATSALSVQADIIATIIATLIAVHALLFYATIIER